MSRPVAAALLVIALLAPLVAQSRPADDINARIRQEENSHSQIMQTLHVLSDVYGPRVTGSPSLKAAGEWAITQMQSWGFSNGHLEPWDFGHPGWVNERFSAHITAPVKDQLTCEVLAWTPGTDGTVTAQAYQLQMPDRPTPAQLTSFLEGEGQKVRGKIVLVGKHTLVPVNITPPAKRRTDEEGHRVGERERTLPVSPDPRAVRRQMEPHALGVCEHDRVRRGHAAARPASICCSE